MTTNLTLKESVTDLYEPEAPELQELQRRALDAVMKMNEMQLKTVLERMKTRIEQKHAVHKRAV